MRTQDTPAEARRRELYGTDAHDHLLEVLRRIDPGRVGQRPPGAVHSMHQVLGHMTFWLDVALARIRREVEADEHGEGGWPAEVEPAGAQEWSERVERLARGLESLEAEWAALADEGDPDHRSFGERNARMVTGHNSYHLGQIVALDKQLAAL